MVACGRGSDQGNGSYQLPCPRFNFGSVELLFHTIIKLKKKKAMPNIRSKIKVTPGVSQIASRTTHNGHL